MVSSISKTLCIRFSSFTIQIWT